MAPKKAKAAAAKPGKPGKPGEAVFTEVERALYELQLTDCNQKLARLREAVLDYEVRYEELQKAFDTLDEDRADVIAFLKKTLKMKNEESAELKETVKSLEELRENETTEFKETVTELEHNFTRMKDQLTAENKLLAGKLNTLEEFRAIKEDLMKKFEQQERNIEEQEMNYKRIIYNTEKKFIIGKDKLKKEMEERLLQLAQDFQDASEMRIAASTHRVIRENIALNNQLDSLLMTQAKLAEQNEKFRDYEKTSICAKEMAEEERDKAMNKSMIQLKVIDQLTTAFEDVKKQKALYDKQVFHQEKMQTKLHCLQKENKNLLLQIRILEQNLHASLGDQNKSVVETAKLLKERETFERILKDSACVVQATLKMDNWATLDPSREIMEREVVLKKILEVINQYHYAVEPQSTQSLMSLSDIYVKGDLGFEVKPVRSKKTQASGLVSSASLQSFEDKHTLPSVLSFAPSISKLSFKTVPSMELFVAEEGSVPTSIDSVPSFTVTSLHSSVSSSVEEESEDEMTKVSRLLAVSKMEVRKSLMADLAISRISQRQFSKLDVNASNKSVHVGLPEKKASVDNFEDQQQKALLRKDKSEPEQDKGEPTQDTDEPTQDTDEPVAVVQENDEDKKNKSGAE